MMGSDSDIERTDASSAARRSPERPERPRLTARTVSRPDGPDRCTVFPPEATGFARMSTWISVDADVVVSLEEFR
jgi:hypothetical protein